MIKMEKAMIDRDQEHKKKKDDDRHVNLYMSTRKGENYDQQ